MTFDEWKAYLTENKDSDEVKELIGTPEPHTVKSVTAYLKTDDGKPILDREINRAVISHDEKRKPEIDKLVADAAKEAEDKTTLTAAEKNQKILEAMQTQLDKSAADLARRDLVISLRTKAEELHVPLDVAVDLENPNLTEAGAVARMEAYAQTNKEQISAEVNRRLVNDSHKPGTGTPAGGAVDLSKLTRAEMIELEEKGEINAKLVQ